MGENITEAITEAFTGTNHTPIVQTFDDDLLSSSSPSSTMDLLNKSLSNIILFFLIFGLSATVDVAGLKRQRNNGVAIGAGVAMQFMVMPLLGFVAVSIFDSGLTKPMSLILLVVTSSPGGSYSNWFCSTFNADLALSVCMTSISSILSVAMLPLNLLFYTWLAYDVVGVGGDDSTASLIAQGEDNQGKTEEKNIIEALDFETIFITLGVVMVAIVLGLLAGWKFDTPIFHQRANWMGTICGFALILYSIVMSFSGGGDDDDNNGEDDEQINIFSHSWQLYISVTLPCLAGMAIANVLARNAFHLSKPATMTTAIECCYQNTGIATSVAITMYTDPIDRAQAVAVPLIYGAVEAVAIALYCIWGWKTGWTKAPPDESFCVVVTKTYENEGHSDKSELDEEAAGSDSLKVPSHSDEDLDCVGQLNDVRQQLSKKSSVNGNRSRLISEDTTSTSCTATSLYSSSTNANSQSINHPSDTGTVDVEVANMAVVTDSCTKK